MTNQNKVKKIEDIIIEYSCNPDDWDLHKTVAEIIEIIAEPELPKQVKGNLCPICGADMNAWQEIFGEAHYCNPLWAHKELADLKAMR